VRVRERAKEGGGTLPRPAHASLEDVLWCLEHDITRRAVYIPRMRNVHVDSLSRERERETRGGSTGVQGGPERVVSGAGGVTGGVCEAGGATNKPCRFALQRKAAAMVLVPTPLSSGVPLRLLVRQDFLSQLGQYHLDPEFSY
jgi:hypothetical protein